MSTLTYLLTCSAATVWFVVLKIVNVLIMTRTNLSRVKERTHMTAPDEKTLTTLTRLFEEEFGPIGDRQVLYVHAPGRSEISGNHTDHEGGHVIAGSLDVAVDGIAVATDSNKVRVADEGYPTFEITLDTLDVQESEKGTSASPCVEWPTRSQRLVLSPRASTLPLPAPSLRAAVFRVLLLSRRHTAAPWKPSGAHPQLSPSHSPR